MSTDLKKGNSSPEVSAEHHSDSPTNQPNSPKVNRSPTNSSKVDRSPTNSPRLNRSPTNSAKVDRSPSNSPKVTRSPTISPKMTRSQSSSSKPSERKPSVEITTQRPLSPVTGHRVPKQEKQHPINKSRVRSKSPQKTFSYLRSDRLNVRKWKERQRQIAKQEEENRIYKENRQKLERLAKIAREPSAYPSINIEHERLRERQAIDHQRKVLKNFIPLLKDNLCIVDRLPNVKGVYDVKKMEEDFIRHKQILKQDAANRKKARETAAQRPFILPKINIKS